MQQHHGGELFGGVALLTSKRARLLDDVTTRTQLASLERKVVSGHEIVTHPSSASAHDDVAASVCGCLVASGTRRMYRCAFRRDTHANWQSMGSYNQQAVDRRRSEWRGNLRRKKMGPDAGDGESQALRVLGLRDLVHFCTRLAEETTDVRCTTRGPRLWNGV